MTWFDDDVTDLSPEDLETVNRFLSDYESSPTNEEEERYDAYWNALKAAAGPSTSGVTYKTPVKKQEEPLDPDLTREDVETSIRLIDDSYGHIDATVKEKYPKNPEKQAKEAKDMAASYDTLRRKYERLLVRIEDRDRAALREKGIRDYDMFSEEGNRAVTEAMDALLSDIDKAQWALKDRVAEALRAKLGEIGATHNEVFDTSVREAIFNDLVVAGLIQAFEPLDF